MPTPAVGSLLAGPEAVGRAAVGGVLGQAAPAQPQGYALGPRSLHSGSGAEWRLYRLWYERSALGDLLGSDRGIADIHKLYECHDRLLEHKQAVFDHLVARWRNLFNVTFDVLLYDLTSTYFESDPPFGEEDKRRFGYSRDRRSDCVQVVIAARGHA
jgi:hypothetical protein